MVNVGKYTILGCFGYLGKWSYVPPELHPPTRKQRQQLMPNIFFIFTPEILGKKKHQLHPMENWNKISCINWLATRLPNLIHSVTWTLDYPFCVWVGPSHRNLKQPQGLTGVLVGFLIHLTWPCWIDWKHWIRNVFTGTFPVSFVMATVFWAKKSNCQISRNKGHSGKCWTVGKLEVLKMWIYLWTRIFNRILACIFKDMDTIPSPYLTQQGRSNKSRTLNGNWVTSIRLQIKTPINTKTN